MENELIEGGYERALANWRFGAAEQARLDRIAAFGAIRRAVAEARRIDRGVFYETDANVIDHREAEAELIRRVIRAAIGSEKA